MSTADRLRERLTAAFSPARLDIVDGWRAMPAMPVRAPAARPTSRVTIVSAAFESLNRVARQRAVYGVLAEELPTRSTR